MTDEIFGTVLIGLEYFAMAVAVMFAVVLLPIWLPLFVIGTVAKRMRTRNY